VSIATGIWTWPVVVVGEIILALFPLFSAATLLPAIIYAAQSQGKVFACEIRYLRRSRLSTAPLRGSGECGWPGLSVSGAARRRDCGLLKRPR
jgi:hypothetical protein